MKKKKRGFLLRFFGPGFITGAADDDPSGIATYSQAGASHGLSFLWLSWVSFPMMAVVQEMCARIGLSTGRGLAANIKANYSRPVLVFVTLLLFAANVINLGADMGAMAKSVQLIFPEISFYLLIIVFGVGSFVLQSFISYGRYVKYLKWLAVSLVLYLFAALSIQNVDWIEVLAETLIPRIAFNKESILLVCAVLGTTISPYLFFWQTSQEVAEQENRGVLGLRGKIRYFSHKTARAMQIDVWFGMFASNLIMFFVIAASALTLFKTGSYQIKEASDAASALSPFVGNLASVCFSVAIVSTGLLALPVLAGSATYAISETFGFKEGRGLRALRGIPFYSTLLLAYFVGATVNILNINSFQILVYAAVVNGLISPIVLYFIVSISSNKKIMRTGVNSSLTKLFGWIITVLMAILAIVTLFFIIS